MNIGARSSGQQALWAMVPAAGKLFPGPVLVDMDPLLVAGRFREAVDTILRDLDPVAGADLGADGGLESR